jgi:hypothetical protein
MFEMKSRSSFNFKRPFSPYFPGKKFFAKLENFSAESPPLKCILYDARTGPNGSSIFVNKVILSKIALDFHKIISQYPVKPFSPDGII